MVPLLGAGQQTEKQITYSRANRHLYKVVPIRLPLDKWEQMRVEASELGIGPTTLARIWILDSLRKEINGKEMETELHKHLDNTL